MILLDTHAVFWLAQVPDMLSERAIEAIRQARRHDGLAIADKTLWELAMLIARKQVGVRTSAREFLQAVEKHFIVLPITGAIADQACKFSRRYPNDPADRLIGATALVHGLQLITMDDGIRNSGEVSCIW